MGSIERFFGVLVEHYAGAFPAWLAPVQVRLLPVATGHEAYAAEVAGQLRAEGLRVDVVDAGDQLGKRIRNAKLEKLPYVLVVGDDDVANGTVGVNPRGGEVERGVGVADFLNRLRSEIDEELKPTPAPELGDEVVGICFDAAGLEPAADVPAVAPQVVEALWVADDVDGLRQVDEHQTAFVHEHVVGRQVAVGVPGVGQLHEHGAQLAEQGPGLGRFRPQLGEARCGGAVGVADQLHHQLRPEQLHRIGHGGAGRPQPAEDGELGGGPLAGDQLLAEGRAGGHCPVLTGEAGASALQIAGVAMEHAVLRVAVALDGQPGAVGVVGPTDEGDVGFLAGLEDAVVLVDGVAGRRDPRGDRRRTAHRIGVVVGGVLGRRVGALGGQPGGTRTAAGIGVDVVVETTPGT